MTKRELIQQLEAMAVPDNTVVMGANDLDGEVFFIDELEIGHSCGEEEAPLLWIKMEIALDEN